MHANDTKRTWGRFFHDFIVSTTHTTQSIVLPERLQMAISVELLQRMSTLPNQRTIGLVVMLTEVSGQHVGAIYIGDKSLYF